LDAVKAICPLRVVSGKRHGLIVSGFFPTVDGVPSDNLDLVIALFPQGDPFHDLLWPPVCLSLAQFCQGYETFALVQTAGVARGPRVPQWQSLIALFPPLATTFTRHALGPVGPPVSLVGLTSPGRLNRWQYACWVTQNLVALHCQWSNKTSVARFQFDPHQGRFPCPVPAAKRWCSIDQLSPTSTMADILWLANARPAVGTYPNTKPQVHRQLAKPTDCRDLCTRRVPTSVFAQ